MTLRSTLALAAIATAMSGATAPAASAATSLLETSIIFLGEIRTRLCFTGGSCNWGDWTTISLKAYVDGDGRIHMYGNRLNAKAVIHVSGQRDAQGYAVIVDGDTLSTEISDRDIYMRYDYTARGSDCDVDFTFRFKDGSGRLDDVRWRKRECVVIPGNRLE